ncbi:transporter [Bacteroidia bacterium]|nr:transporter [Bacteroidia bacterium]
MNKNILFIVSFVTLCISSVYAQPDSRDKARPTPTTIDELFQMAEENNRSIRAYSTAIEETKASIKSAKNAYLPSIDISLSLSYNGNGTITDRNFSNALTAPIPHFGNNFSIEASQVIFAGGAIRNGVKIAELQSQMAAINVEKNRREVRFLIAGNYLELCKLQNQLQVFESNIVQTQKVLENMRGRVNEGVALQNDITRYELQLQNLNYTKIQLQNTMSLINNQLTTAVGLPQSVVIVPDTAATVGALSARALHATPLQSAWVVQIAEKAEQMAGHAEKISRAERLPQIALFAGNYLNGPVTIEIPAPNNNFNYWAVGVGVKYSLGNLYKSNAKIRSKQLAAKRAGEEKAVAEEQISLALEEAYTHYQEAFSLLETKEKSVELSAQNYNVISGRYENDLALITDLLDASSQKLDAELQVINAKINIIYNYYKFKYISGAL